MEYVPPQTNTCRACHYSHHARHPSTLVGATTLHLDNQGVLWGLRTGKVGLQRRCVRRLMYAPAKGGTSVHVSHVASAIMPADYLFRFRTNSARMVIRTWHLGPPRTTWRICCLCALRHNVGACCSSNSRAARRRIQAELVLRRGLGVKRKFASKCWAAVWEGGGGKVVGCSLQSLFAAPGGTSNAEAATCTAGC